MTADSCEWPFDELLAAEPAIDLIVVVAVVVPPVVCSGCRLLTLLIVFSVESFESLSQLVERTSCRLLAAIVVVFCCLSSFWCRLRSSSSSLSSERSVSDINLSFNIITE